MASIRYIYSSTIRATSRAIIEAHASRIVANLNLTKPVVIVVGCPRSVGNSRARELIAMGANGAYDESDGTVHVVYINKHAPRLTHTIAHELRHAYQYEYNTLGEYEYDKAWHERKHERDAEAYAGTYVDGPQAWQAGRYQRAPH